METAKSKNQSATHRTVTQTLVPIVIIIGLVAGVTFVYQSTNRAPERTQEENPSVPAVRLSFPETSVDTTKDYTLYTTGNFDFWFRNPQPGDVEVGLVKKNCDCTDVRVATLSREGMADPGEWNRFVTWAAPTQAGLLGLAAQAPLVGYLVRAVDADTELHRRLGEKLRWHAIETGSPEQSEQTATVPAGAVGLMRLVWEAKKEQNATTHVQVEFWTRAAGSQDLKTRNKELNIPLRFVHAVRFEPDNLAHSGLFIGVVEASQTRAAEFVCWSSTVDALHLRAWAENPCIRPSVRPLTITEKEGLERVRDTTVHAGYVVRIEVCGSRDGKLMDLGPFAQHVHLAGTAPEPDAFPDLIVAGTVHGEVTVTSPAPEQGGAPTQDEIHLGSFRSDRGKSITATIEARRAGTRVVKERLEPPLLNDLIEVRLAPRKGGDAEATWDLEVKVPADRLHGPLPQHSAILLKVLGDSSRGIRIPITGRAYTELRAR